ncbi:glucose-6-phosphate exchanger SLC37A2-like [Dysidea avara]|uniref:glucose-6-phosphate exchanger SLC37A2-like n=1 Tax=Dysidea avara TaxID=196820 RepID=UPI003328EEBE
MTEESSERQQLLSKKGDLPRVQYHRLPAGIWLIERVGLLSRLNPKVKKKYYQVLIVVLTFCCYATYHLTRKTISVVKSTLHPDCNSSGECANPSNHCKGWEPFDSSNGKTLLGTLDYAWLFSYAVAMFFSGQLADRSNLRYFLTFGMLGSCISMVLFGMGYFLNVHKLYYFISVQVIGGIFQSSGWPAVVAVMANWYGRGRRGFIMGIWNCHTSVGSILGAIIPAIWAHHHWGWSFLVSTFFMAAVAIAVFLILVIDPVDLALPPPQHHLKSERDMDSSVTSKDDSEWSTNQQMANKKGDGKAISFWRALLIPGLVEFSIVLFFAKLVSYSFLFWLPFYIKNIRIGGHCLNTFQSSALSTMFDVGGMIGKWYCTLYPEVSTMFDVGGMIGGILAGLFSDVLQARAFTAAITLYLCIPSLYLYRELGGESLAMSIILMLITGACVNGSNPIISAAVSADLGTHKSLKGNQKAKATVTSIINGTGSIGAAVGPLITGVLASNEDWDSVFYLFMGASLIAALLLSRLVYGEMKTWWYNCATKPSTSLIKQGCHSQSSKTDNK